MTVDGKARRLDAWIACCLGTGPLAPLGDTDVAALSDEIGARSYAGGTTVFGQGDALTHTHVVQKGSVELCRRVGARRVAIQIVRPGEVFGDVPMLLQQPAPFDARALEDTVVLSIEAGHLVALLGRRPRLALRWMVSLAERSAKLHRRLAVLLAGGLEAQVASLLLERAEGGELHLTQSVIADLLGAGRSSVNRVLKDLEAQDLITLGYRKVVVGDRGGLASVAGHDPPASADASS